MCLIVFAWDVHPKYKLILAANRDEFYHRPTAPLGYWEDQPEILGGRDLEAGGSWMAVNTKGKFAAVTNYRDLKNIKKDATSRGEIPTNFLTQEISPMAYLEGIDSKASDYNGFNALIGDQKELLHYSNYENIINAIQPGIYGLSNALLDTPWPKVKRAKEKFSNIIHNDWTTSELIKMMEDDTLAQDAQLPDTGVPFDLEKGLSPMCIRMENYGTRCTTVITMDRVGQINFTERSFPVGERKDHTIAYSIQL
jgi:uncharacterized protein with NRDE domain